MRWSLTHSSKQRPSGWKKKIVIGDEASASVIPGRAPAAWSLARVQHHEGRHGVAARHPIVDPYIEVGDKFIQTRS